MSLVGDLGTDVLRTTRINKGFLGARGLSLERGLMDLNPDEVRIKQEMADACERVYGIFDGTKWHRSALLSFVPADDLPGIVTDSSAPAEEVEAWRAAGVEVVDGRPGPARAAAAPPRDLRRAVRERRSGRLMTAMAAVDLGAQSGRVAVGRFDGERLERRGGPPLRQRPVEMRRHAALGRRTRLYRDVLDGLRAAARDGRPRRRSPSTRGRVDFGLLDAAGGLLGRTRCTTATAAAPPRSSASSSACRARELYERPASSSCRSTRSSSSPRWPRTTTGA